MTTAELVRIQNLILQFLSVQRDFVREEKLRDVCKAAEFSVVGKSQEYALHRLLLPLVRAGMVEYGIIDHKHHWQLAKPQLFSRRFPDGRHWIGINLTEEQKRKIPFQFISSQQNGATEVHCNVVRWISPESCDMAGFPLVQNRPVENLLRIFPECSPDVFANYEAVVLPETAQIYSPGQSCPWRSVSEKAVREDGLYRQGNQVYSPRWYFRNHRTYRLDNNNPDSPFWARAMHWIDHKRPIATFDSLRQQLHFHLAPPIMIGRLLLLNELFSDFQVNSLSYSGINQKIVYEIQRIFHNNIQEINHS